MRFLFVIPARGGSKGLPGKNIKVLNGKPLILYSLHYARLFSTDEHICISTDDKDITAVAEADQYQMPFVRPAELATDSASMREVLIHALDKYEEKGQEYDAIVLLQPTSPFRRHHFFEEAAKLFDSKPDMVVSVNESKANPYFNLFEENSEGFLKPSKLSGVLNRQQAPPIYQYNGNLYIINTKSLRLYKSLAEFPKIVKYLVPAEYGVDIDTSADWNNAEFLLKNHLVDTDGKLQDHSKT